MTLVSFFVAVVVFVLLRVSSHAQAEITDAQLEAASAGRVVRLGPASGRGRIEALPLEVYVARVLAGESEPRAPEAALQALAIAVRTFALANAGRHARDSFDVCDDTHCQVPRPATAATRRAALATAGQLLLYNGAPAELFYSASCGGHSESAAQVWPGADYPYLPAAPDEVHADEAPWTVELTLEQVERALKRGGFAGRLRDVRVEARSASGRAARLQLPGLVPDVIAGEQFRAAIGTTTLRSTAFEIDRRGGRLHFTGRGFGHGVGLCVIGAGRRALRGERAEAILARYYPGLALARLDATIPLPVVAASAGRPAEPPATRTRGAIAVQVPSSSPVDAAEVERLTTLAHEALGKTLGVSVAPITVRIHESLESFRQATGRPWWVSSVSDRTSIDLVPAALLAQRDGLERALRTAVAELLIAPALNDRPLWVRVGAARYFGREDPRAPADAFPGLRCPADAELTLAISAAAQREAEARAEACFARGYARTRDWRTVR
ncbi:MAG: SpoIID/LytB domain-containing protein [Acidobacteria bacterium]|nr:SpoIID/LytB domain-containing protein [Acidobacteriota bacterium]